MAWLGFLIEIMFYIIMGIIIYIITDKFNYITNVIIYAVATTLLVIFTASGVTFGGIILQLILNGILGLIVIGIAQSIRDGFEYDTIIGYIIVVGITHALATALVGWIVSLF